MIFFFSFTNFSAYDSLPFQNEAFSRYFGALEIQKLKQNHKSLKAAKNRGNILTWSNLNGKRETNISFWLLEETTSFLGWQENLKAAGQF